MSDQFAAGASPGTRPNVLLVVVDSLRADAVFGPGSHDTPALDGLVTDGIAFEACFSQGISTAPAMCAMLTGRYPLDYGGHWYIEGTQPTFAEQFRDAGYRTGAIHSNPYVSSRRNFDRGFEEFQEDVGGFEPDLHLGGFPDRVRRLGSRVHRLLRKAPYTPAPAVNDQVRDWIAAEDGRPWFLWVQYMDVHGPYLPGGEFSYYEKLRAEWLWRKAAVRNPDGITGDQHRELLGNYRREVEYFDREFGELLDWMDANDITERTVVIVVADHGDEFDEHGWYGHRNLPFDELTRVPLIMRFPDSLGGPRGARIDDLVRCIDVLPTVADYADVSFSDAMEERLVGASLRPLIEDGQEPPFDTIVTEKKVWSGTDLRFGFRTDDWKYLYDGKDEASLLFDLKADPEETENVSGDHPDVAARFRERLNERLSRIERTTEGVELPDVMPTAGVEERLRALGYR